MHQRTILCLMAALAFSVLRVDGRGEECKTTHEVTHDGCGRTDGFKFFVDNPFNAEACAFPKITRRENVVGQCVAFIRMNASEKHIGICAFKFIDPHKNSYVTVGTECRSNHNWDTCTGPPDK